MTSTDRIPAATPPTGPSPARPATIRTFHPRRGRLSGRHLDALDRLGPVYRLAVPDLPIDDTEYANGTSHTTDTGHANSTSYAAGTSHATDAEPAPPTRPLDLPALFGRHAPVVLEIGSGMGEATAAMAAADPGRDYLAVEVHTPGIANLLAMIDRRGLTNVRIADGDALVLLRRMLPPASLTAIHVFFPDPWPKARHHKRRLIQPRYVALMRSRLIPGGRLSCATDHHDYARGMRDTLAADPELMNVYSGFAPRPDDRPVTKFERRALAARRPVYDLVFDRSSPNGPLPELTRKH